MLPVSKDAKQPREAAKNIPVPDIYADAVKDKPGVEATQATPEYHEPEGFDPYDTASLHRK